MASYLVEVPTAEYWQRQVKCQEACPVHTDARGYVRAIAEGRYEDAYLIARGPNPLASICGRVCGAPCEAACRRSDLDQAISIRALKRFVTDRYAPGGENAKQGSSAFASPLGLIRRLVQHAGARTGSREEELAGLRRFLSAELTPRNADGEKVAIIGSGPAGLAAAHDLALLGMRPVIYELEAVPAGMLAVGIPEYRLPRDLIAAEVDFIRGLGVEFVCNTEVGKDITLEQIRQTHRATVIAVGLKRSRTLELPGSQAKGIYGGVELLREVALGRPVDLQGDVVVIGGGNVAYDVARTVVRQTGVDISRTALRQVGVRSVHLCSLESLQELPADDAEIIEGDEEGVIRHHSLGPVEFRLNDEGRVAEVVLQRCLRVFDESGRFAPTFDAGDLTTIPADTVLWSIGQRPVLTFLESATDVEFTERGLPRCDPLTLQTTAGDIFLAGDIAHGPRLLIDAVASGKKVARSIFECLRGEKLRVDVTLEHCDIPGYGREADYEKLERTAIPTLSPHERLATQRQNVELGYGEPQAVREGCRCLDCGVNTIFDSEKCILCGGCADVCPELCLELVSLDKLAGGAELQRVLGDHCGGDRDQFSAIIKDETCCIRCALCAERCPVGAITMERANFANLWTLSAATAGG